MPDRRHRFPCTSAERIDVKRHGAPHGDSQVTLDQLASPLVPIEHDADRVSAAQQLLRDLDQQAGAVAALTVRVETASVGQPGERLDAERDGVVAEVGRGNEAHAAGSSFRREVPRPGKAR